MLDERAGWPLNKYLGCPRRLFLSSYRVAADPNTGGSIMAVVCPECDNPISIDADEVEEGETVQCDECGVDLEIVSVDPIELAAVDEAGYDDEGSTHIDEEEDE
jgi:alpha-aminoadipate/glutamate carrier protein LysW